MRLLAAAEEDLTDIITFVAADDAAAAESLLERFRLSLENLRKYPDIGRLADDEELTRIGYRYLIQDNYLIFYTIKRQSVLMHRIIHGARDYEGML